MAGALLPHPFTLTCIYLHKHIGGFLSAALVVSSRYPGVTWHPALLKPGLSSPLIASNKSSDDLANSVADYTG